MSRLPAPWVRSSLTTAELPSKLHPQGEAQGWLDGEPFRFTVDDEPADPAMLDHSTAIDPGLARARAAARRASLFDDGVAELDAAAALWSGLDLAPFYAAGLVDVDLMRRRYGGPVLSLEGLAWLISHSGWGNSLGDPPV